MVLGVAQDTRSRDGCPLQAPAFDGAVVDTGVYARLGMRGVELPPGPPDQQSPGTRESQSQRERATQSGGTRQASPFRSAPFERCFLTRVTFPVAKVTRREILKALLPPCERRCPRGSSGDAFGLQQADGQHAPDAQPRQPDQPLNSLPGRAVAHFAAGRALHCRRHQPDRQTMTEDDANPHRYSGQPRAGKQVAA